MFEPRHIWITGAGSGIGAAIAHDLSAQHNVSISGRNTARLADVITHMPRGSNAVAHVCDVTDEHSVHAAHAVFAERNGPVDVLVNAAGIGVFKPLIELSVEEFDKQIATNLRGIFLCVKAVLPAMLERKHGQIITINSIASITAYTQSTGYGASKAGALALTRSLRNEVRDSGIKVHDLLVGATATGIWSKAMLEEFGHRMMQPQDVAAAVTNLVVNYSNPRTHIEELILRPQRGDL